ncbi:hypothetical protein EHP00_653 [Ecytonucleospora hepatopenaei]|uniref:Uncharacterized protein n=1 Tax=Ecytonucleospora hepatopenaei TaxID=646526 RepID=A0A1W0E8I5_9MICR|nr:hypothetical protein EHP00_2535 [Ecytonucleospora hepatopenaei]OQS55577.1 hypothetical protein EHP00_653 [Ecytonucleospora hepatopenaei]
MIFTPTSLKLLLDFKTSTEHLPSIELLSSLLDNKLSINLKSLYFILYAHTKKEYFLTNEEVEEVGLKKLKTETEVFLQNKTLIENNPCILRIPFEDKVFYILEKEYENIRIKTLGKLIINNFYIQTTVFKDNTEVDVIYSSIFKHSKREYLPSDFGPKTKNCLKINKIDEKYISDAGLVDQTLGQLLSEDFKISKEEKKKVENTIKMLVQKSKMKMKIQSKEEKIKRLDEQKAIKEKEKIERQEEREKAKLEKLKKLQEKRELKEKLIEEKKKLKIEKEKLKHDENKDDSKIDNSFNYLFPSKNSQKQPHSKISEDGTDEKSNSIKRNLTTNKNEFSTKKVKIEKEEDKNKVKTLFDMGFSYKPTLSSFIESEEETKGKLFLPNKKYKEFISLKKNMIDDTYSKSFLSFLTYNTSQRRDLSLNCKIMLQFIIINNYVEINDVKDNISERYKLIKKILNKSTEEYNTYNQQNINIKWHVYSFNRIENVLDYDNNSEYECNSEELEGESVHTNEKDSDTEINEKELDKVLMGEEESSEDKDVFIKNTKTPRFLTEEIKIIRFK